MKMLWREIEPIEHGSWGLFLMPLAVGILVGRDNPGALALLALSALGVFLMRRPALRWLRAFNREPLDAIRTPWPARPLAACLALVVGGGLPLVLMGRPWLLVLFGLALLLIAGEVVMTKREGPRSLFMELAQVWVLCLLAPTAYYVATGSIGPRGWTLWALCAIYFSVTITDIRVKLAKRRVKTGQAGPELLEKRRADRFLIVVAGVIASVTTALLAPAHAKALWALVPLLWRFIRQNVLRVSNPTSVQSLGWQEVYLSIVFVALAVWLA